MKEIIFKILRNVLSFALNWIYSYIDDDKDGKITKKEIKATIEKFKKIKLLK